MTLTALQRQTLDAVVSVFETGHLPSVQAYSTATVLPDGAGISYGSHQATRAALQDVLDGYAVRGGSYTAAIRSALKGHALSELEVYSSEAACPDWARTLLSVLRLAGADSVMRAAQDDVFRRQYQDPAIAYCGRIGLVEPLSALAVFDTAIQSGLGRVDKLRPTFAADPPIAGGQERKWTRQFLLARRRWLAAWTHTDPARQTLVRRTVYRVDALLELAAEDRWALERPLTVRGVEIR